MSAPRMPPDLRLGCLLLDDILRALGGYQWFLSNLASGQHLSAPLMAEIMAHLHTAGLVAPHYHEDAGIHYEEIVTITRENLRPPLTRKAADELLARICLRAEQMNREDPFYEVRSLYLFGSCLRDAEAPHDIDIAVEIFGDGTLLPMPDDYPFSRTSEFDDAARPLALRKPKVIALHHIEEVRALGAPHRLVWSAAHGRIRDAPILTPERTWSKGGTHEERLRVREAQQKQLDQLVCKIRSIEAWPVMAAMDHPQGPAPTHALYQSWLRTPTLLAQAHLRCLPACTLRDHIQSVVERVVKKSRQLRAAWDQAAPLVEPYIRGSLHYSRWARRDDGRLIRRDSPPRLDI